MNEIESLRQEVAVLRQKIDETDDWANGIHQVLVVVLPFLLRGHPEAGKVEGLLRSYSERYDELKSNLGQSENWDESAQQLEAGKSLYRQLAILGVWPGVDPAIAQQQALEHAGLIDREPGAR